MSKADYTALIVDLFKHQHPNHKCIKCKHRCVHAYEDDSPAGYTPYHWWHGICDATNKEIESDTLPPEGCPFEAKSASSTEA